jgi:hypothetical protein
MPRNIRAGVAIGFLSFFHNNKAMIAGATMLIVAMVVKRYMKNKEKERNETDRET